MNKSSSSNINNNDNSNNNNNNNNSNNNNNNGIVCKSVSMEFYLFYVLAIYQDSVTCNRKFEAIL